MKKKKKKKTFTLSIVPFFIISFASRGPRNDEVCTAAYTIITYNQYRTAHLNNDTQIVEINLIVINDSLWYLYNMARTPREVMSHSISISFVADPRISNPLNDATIYQHLQHRLNLNDGTHSDASMKENPAARPS